VWRVNPTSGESTPIPFSAGAAMPGVDGLYLAGDWLVGVQNIVGTARVLAWRLDTAHAKVVARRVLAVAMGAFEVPTTGAVVGTVFYLLANSNLNGAHPQDPPIVLQMPLGA